MKAAIFTTNGSKSVNGFTLSMNSFMSSPILLVRGSSTLGFPACSATTWFLTRRVPTVSTRVNVRASGDGGICGLAKVGTPLDTVSSHI
jgi:hypothetical protein